MADLDIALVSIIELLPSFVDIVKDPLQLGSGSIGSIVREAKNANFNGRPIESSAGYLNSTVRLDRSEIIVNRRLLRKETLARSIGFMTAASTQLNFGGDMTTSGSLSTASRAAVLVAGAVWMLPLRS